MREAIKKHNNRFTCNRNSICIYYMSYPQYLCFACFCIRHSELVKRTTQVCSAFVERLLLTVAYIRCLIQHLNFCNKAFILCFSYTSMTLFVTRLICTNCGEQELYLGNIFLLSLKVRVSFCSFSGFQPSSLSLLVLVTDTLI